MLHISAPGKLMIAGEWAVLEPGTACIAAAVDRRVHAQIEEWPEAPAEWIKPRISVTIEEYGIVEKHAEFDGVLGFSDLTPEQTEKLKFIKAALEVALSYCQQKTGNAKNFKIKTWDEELQIEVDGKPQKIGFGSSAAAVVAVVGAVLEFHGIHIETHRQEVFKLAAAAHFGAQGKLGSCFDIAASTYGGVIAYIAPDLPKVVEELKSKKIKDVVDSKWPLLHIQQLPIPEDLVLAVCWTKSSASTTEMIKALNEWKGSAQGRKYAEIMEEISEIVDQLIVAWKLKNRERILELIRKNEERLRELTQISGVPIETYELKKLSEIADSFGAAGKLSGAGGGDCGIAICFDERTAEDIKGAWRDAGLWPLDVGIDSEGVNTENP